MRRRGVMLGWLFLAACSDGNGAVRFADLEDGAVIGGPELTRIETDLAGGALRADLFLDGERVGSAEAAPFEVEWDATRFREGQAELVARVEAADGSVEEAALTVVIDNTPPTVQPIESPRIGGQEVSIRVDDQHRIVAVKLVGAGVDLTWSGLPAVVTWPDVCEVGEVTVSATDEAGWTTTVTSVVESFAATDADCDGYVSALADPAGPDCDDGDPAVHPAQIDLGPLGDVNCDGVAGTDADGDGIAGIGEEGRDCNDLDPTVHPGGTLYAPEAVQVSGLDVDWEPGAAAAFERSGLGEGVGLAINDDGSIRFVEVSVAGASRSTLTEEANPRWIEAVYSVEDTIFYGRGRDARALVRRGAEWTDELVLIADQPIGRVAGAVVELTDRGAIVAARSGPDLHLARRGPGGWEAQQIDASAGRPEDSVSVVVRDGPVIDVAYVTEQGIRLARVAPDGAVELVDMDAGPDMDRAAGVCPTVSGDAAYYVAGDCLASTDQLVAIECPGPIERLFCHGDEVAFQVRGGALGVLSGSGLEYRDVHAEVLARTTPDSVGIALAPGVVYRRDRTIAPPDDPIGGPDRNCDDRD